jgi:hypothetical protein
MQHFEMKIGILVTAILVLILSSCSSNDDKLCYSFDERQCAVDRWMAVGVNPLTAEEKIESLKWYLSSQDISVIKVAIDADFHEVVCEACGVCPSGPRYYVSIEEGSQNALSDLALLNFSTSDKCP